LLKGAGTEFSCKAQSQIIKTDEFEVNKEQ
jgi:hypothetical protein